MSITITLNDGTRVECASTAQALEILRSLQGATGARPPGASTHPAEPERRLNWQERREEFKRQWIGALEELIAAGADGLTSHELSARLGLTTAVHLGPLVPAWDRLGVGLPAEEVFRRQKPLGNGPLRWFAGPQAQAGLDALTGGTP